MSGAGLPNGRKLFTVEETFTVHHRGTVLLPGLVPQGIERFRIGDPLRLVRPDGTELSVLIDGMDFFHPGPRGEFAVLVRLAQADVPLGTEVWSMSAAPGPEPQQTRPFALLD